jgi:hypothetical protein
MRCEFILTGLLMVLLVIPVGSLADVMEFDVDQAAAFVGEEDGIYDARVLLSFDLSDLPANAQVSYAGLRLFDETDLPWEAPHVPVTVAALTTDWDTSASWDGPSSGESWDNDGGDWHSALTSYRVLVLDPGAPAKFLMTEIVQQWVGSEIPNYGIIAWIEEVADLQDIVQYFNAQTLKPSLQVRYFLPSQDGP